MLDFPSAIFLCVDVVYADEENVSNCISASSVEKVIDCIFDPRFILD